jgi:hypothetical protein
MVQAWRFGAGQADAGKEDAELAPGERRSGDSVRMPPEA